MPTNPPPRLTDNPKLESFIYSLDASRFNERYENWKQHYRELLVAPGHWTEDEFEKAFELDALGHWFIYSRKDISEAFVSKKSMPDSKDPMLRHIYTVRDRTRSYTVHLLKDKDLIFKAIDAIEKGKP